MSIPLIIFNRLIERERRVALRKVSIFKDRLNPFDINDEEFLKTTRFTKNVFIDIIELCKPLERRTKRSVKY